MMTLENNSTLTRALVSACAGVLVCSSVFAQTQTAAAFFSGEATATGNTISAGMLAFDLVPATASAIQNYNATSTVTTSVDSDADSIDFQYRITADATSCTTAFENELRMSATRDGTTEASRQDLNTFSATSTSMAGGDWAFAFYLPADSSVVHNATCDIDITFDAWQTQFSDATAGGFSASNTLTVELTANTVVLNEILPDPVGNDYANRPDGEWVELYNNASTDHDLSGWKITDDHGNDVPIGGTVDNASTTPGGTTTIGDSDWLVVYMNKRVMNNGGDTVKLVDANGAVRDQYAFGESIDNGAATTTQSAANATSTDAYTTQEGKSHARIPDGTGVWIDPEPTAGKPNTVSRQALEQAGYGESRIEQILRRQQAALAEWRDKNAEKTEGGTQYADATSAAEQQQAENRTSHQDSSMDEKESPRAATSTSPDQQQEGSAASTTPESTDTSEQTGSTTPDTASSTTTPQALESTHASSTPDADEQSPEPNAESSNSDTTASSSAATPNQSAPEKEPSQSDDTQESAPATPRERKHATKETNIEPQQRKTSIGDDQKTPTKKPSAAEDEHTQETRDAQQDDTDAESQTDSKDTSQQEEASASGATSTPQS